MALTPEQRLALDELRRKVLHEFEIKGFVLYGSVARGEADEESDLDLLIVTARPLVRTERHKITDLVFETNLRHGTNFSSLVVDRYSWEEGPLSILPLREEILQEGIAL